jgi:hypothetical protein
MSIDRVALPGTRIVALAVIAVLLPLWSTSASLSVRSRVSVPHGAEAGDLTLKRCTYATEGVGGSSAPAGSNPQVRDLSSTFGAALLPEDSRSSFTITRSVDAARPGRCSR